jgi:hypothetical protein
VSTHDRPWRAVGFLLLVLGFGLRLDTDWQRLAWLLLLAGAGVTGRGLWLLWRRDAGPDDAFVRQAGRR